MLRTLLVTDLRSGKALNMTLARNPNEEPLSIEPELTQISPSKVSQPGEAPRSFGGAAGLGHAGKEVQFKRPLNLTGKGGTRCRIFHSKISVSSLNYMETQINEWIDNSKIEVKQVGHVVGPMEGKSLEPNMIVMIWY